MDFKLSFFTFFSIFYCLAHLKELKFLKECPKIVSDFKKKSVKKNLFEISDIENNKVTQDTPDVKDKKKEIKALGPVVRKKNERINLKARKCNYCDQFWRSMNLSEEKLKQKLHKCSRHRYNVSPPKTPEHFWDTDFPDIAECKTRGYIYYK